MSPTKQTLLTALNGVQDLPTLPSVAARLQEVLHQERTTAQDIARIISTDPTLTTNVLRVVNSAYYAGRSGRISSVQHAVARLGFREVSRICTVLSIIETFRGIGPHLDHKVFWRHSLMTGLATRVIHRSSPRAATFPEEESYVAGLLHDIGILILDQYFPALYQRTRTQAEEKTIPYNEEEQDYLGMDHGEVGAVVLDRWNLSEAVTQAVTWHHQPHRCDPEYHDLVCTVHVADSLALQALAADFSQHAFPAPRENAWRTLGLRPEETKPMLDRLLEETDQCEALLHL